MKTTLTLTLALPLALIALAGPAPLLADDAAADSSPTLDELLELEPEPAEPSPDPTEPADGQAKDGEVKDGEPGDSDAGDSVSEALDMAKAADVFDEAVVQMEGVSRRLGEQRDPGRVTQRTQREIIQKLEQVIAAAKQQQGGGGKDKPSSKQQQQQSRSIAKQGSASSPSNSPSSQSHSGDFSPGSAQEHEEGGDLEELREEWGSLPPRLRNELSEGLSEPFSPVYRELTESFYRRLGEEQE
ncbi:MAG: hypothetical protein ACOC3G_00585 [Phycisphaeraceae bacterium]